MNSGRLRDTLALLLRENDRHPATLSADAERAIRRRIGLRWAGRISAVVVVGSLGTATVVGAYGGWDGGGAVKSPIPTPTIGVAAATFPVAGGPEFASPAAGLKCGDPAPKAHPEEHDVALTLTATNPSYTGDPVQNSDDTPSVEPHLSQKEGTELGVLANSAISLIIERDGVVVGVVNSAQVSLGWNQLGAASNQGQYSSPLVATWIFCPGEDFSKESSFEPGTYDVVGITRVFQTPESVALYQELGLANGTWQLDPASLDPAGIYLPGSYDCAQSIAQQSPARGCLPDFTPDAKLDAEAATITMLYDTGDLVDEFSVVLVSNPVTVTIPGMESLAWLDSSHWESLGTFDSIDDFTCGASAGNNAMDHAPGIGVVTSLYEESAGPIFEGGPFTALAFAAGFPDGSRVDLLEGARLVYLQDSMISDPAANSGINVQTVVGSSPFSAAAPFTTDRFAGPQTVSFASDPVTVCPGIDLAAVTGSSSFVLVGTWNIEAPDGTVTAVDVGNSLWYWGY